MQAKSAAHREAIRAAHLARGRGKAPKRCSKCGLVKDRSEFSRRKNGHSRSPCKACDVLARARYCNEHPDKIREINRRTSLRRWFGITEDQFAEMLKAHGGVCAICKQQQKSGRRLYIDHCHTRNIIRGLLCDTCNRAIGLLKDDPAILRAAADYLERKIINPIKVQPGMPSGHLRKERQRLHRERQRRRATEGE